MDAWLATDSAAPRLRGERVLMREWMPSDLEPFAALERDELRE